ncbi:hypothetical protein BC749_108258 [Flavobacterium araucananum]|uniref:UPF0489 family protein n=1 Tax=Flavobacterium araucananum TaxID=946678 RepID=UPI000D6B68FF|nr:hypothetical protein [Flavobacterium araucananum]PWJ97107.1 hypothetical protein BC749_108258 [Flavobacterium araucananum]
METIIFNGKNHSGAYDLNLLCNQGKVYIMDNHLAASWCWLQKVDVNKQYNFLHIDRHYDLLNSQLDWWIEALENQNIDITNLTIEELISLRYSHENMPTNDTYPIFRWDNYITILDRIFPNLLALNTFATHKDGDAIEEIEISEIDAWDLQENLSYWVNDTDQKWIVNLDIDYFFTNYDGDRYFQLFSDEFVIRIAREIRKSMKNIEVLTIALSPEMCGNWANSERIAKLVVRELGIEWQI